MPRKRKPGRPRRPGRPKITGKYAKKQSPTIKDLKGIMRKTDHAWSKKRPKTLKDRNDLMNTCGDACFLDRGVSGTNDYAVCKKCSKKTCYCYPDCDALLEVKRLAYSKGQFNIEQSAQDLAEELGCDWNEAIKFILTEKYSKTLQLI